MLELQRLLHGPTRWTVWGSPEVLDDNLRAGQPQQLPRFFTHRVSAIKASIAPSFFRGVMPGQDCQCLPSALGKYASISSGCGLSFPEGKCGRDEVDYGAAAKRKNMVE